MQYISICKNIIQSNNKKGWVDPDPPIRVSNSKSGKVVGRYFSIDIMDENGKVVGHVITTRDGSPVTKAGAKVVLVTEYPVKEM